MHEGAIKEACRLTARCTAKGTVLISEKLASLIQLTRFVKLKKLHEKSTRLKLCALCPLALKCDASVLSKF